MPLRTPLLFGLCTLAALATWAFSQAADPPPAQAPAERGGDPGSPLAVSLVQLIATPDAYHGKYVRLQGYVRIEHEGTAVYLHREDWEHMLTRNGLWLAVNDAAPEGSKEAQVNNRYALVEGRFNARMKGHRGLWSGSLDRITRMEPWQVRGKGK